MVSISKKQFFFQGKKSTFPVGSSRRGILDVTPKEMNGLVRTLGQEGVFMVPGKDGRQCREVTGNIGPADNPGSLTEQVKDVTLILSALVKSVCEND